MSVDAQIVEQRGCHGLQGQDDFLGRLIEQLLAALHKCDYFPIDGCTAGNAVGKVIIPVKKEAKIGIVKNRVIVAAQQAAGKVQVQCVERSSLLNTRDIMGFIGTKQKGISPTNLIDPAADGVFALAIKKVGNLERIVAMEPWRTHHGLDNLMKVMHINILVVIQANMPIQHVAAHLLWEKTKYYLQIAIYLC